MAEKYGFRCAIRDRQVKPTFCFTIHLADRCCPEIHSLDVSMMVYDIGLVH